MSGANNKPNEPQPVAGAGGVTDADKKLLAHIVSWVHCPAIMSVEQVEQMISAHRLQSVATATAAKDAEIARLREALHAIDVEAFNTIPPDGADAAFAALQRIARQIDPFRSSALSEAREAGDSLAAGDRV